MCVTCGVFGDSVIRFAVVIIGKQFSTVKEYLFTKKKKKNMLKSKHSQYIIKLTFRSFFEYYETNIIVRIMWFISKAKKKNDSLKYLHHRSAPSQSPNFMTVTPSGEFFLLLLLLLLPPARMKIKEKYKKQSKMLIDQIIKILYKTKRNFWNITSNTLTDSTGPNVSHSSRSSRAKFV